MPRRTRDAVIAVLVLVNVVLLCAVLAHTIGLPKAQAQAMARSGQFLAVAGHVQSGVDAQYLLDTTQQRLYVFSPTRSGSTVMMQLTDMRDLRVDFAKQPTPTIPPRNR